MAETQDYRVPLKSPADTVADAAPVADALRTVVDNHGIAATLDSNRSLGAMDTLGSLGAGRTMEPRTTVLPRWDRGEVLSETGIARYERLRPLGEGGIGEVALAHDHDIDRTVAIKRLRPEHRGTSTLLRFAQEVRTVGRLEHPNIVPVHDVGLDEDGQVFFVMKYVEGETLESVIEKLQAGDAAYLRRFPFETRSQVFLGILRAVQYAHARGIIHRDIKPANVMVGPFGEVMVMDWGLAKQLQAATDSLAPAEPPASADAAPIAPIAPGKKASFQTQHGAVMGTPAYMAPEQARGEIDRLDERTDVYSLAVLFHEFVTLRHYLHDKTTMEDVLIAVATAANHETGIAGWVSQAVASGAPMEILHFVRKGLAADPAQRYANAGEMAAALQDMLAGRVKIQCHISALKRLIQVVGHWIDRHVVLATVGLLATVVAALVGVVALARLAVAALHGG